MFKGILKGLLGRLAGYALFGLGFWLLYQGFLRPSILLGLLGGAMILAGMYLMVTVRRWSSTTVPAGPDIDGKKEADSGDSLEGGGPGDKLPP